MCAGMVLGGGKNKVRCESCGGMRGRRPSGGGFARQKTEPGWGCKATINGGEFEGEWLVRNRDGGLRPQTEPGMALQAFHLSCFM